MVALVSCNCEQMDVLRIAYKLPGTNSERREGRDLHLWEHPRRFFAGLSLAAPYLTSLLDHSSTKTNLLINLSPT